jgi:hypothetical protein
MKKISLMIALGILVSPAVLADPTAVSAPGTTCRDNQFAKPSVPKNAPIEIVHANPAPKTPARGSGAVTVIR